MLGERIVLAAGLGRVQRFAVAGDALQAKHQQESPAAETASAPVSLGQKREKGNPLEIV